MLLTHFRKIQSNPPKILSIISSHKYFITAHNTSFISLFTLQSFTPIFTYNTLHTITAIELYSNTHLIVAFKESKLMIIDLLSFQSKIHNIDFNIVNFKRDKTSQTVYAQNTNNQIYKFNHNINLHNIDISLICTSNLNIQTWTIIDQTLIIIDNLGYLKIYQEHNLIKDFQIKKKTYTNVEYLNNNLYVLISNDSTLCVIDVQMESVMCEMQVCKFPLNALGVIENKIFCAGEDNRIVCYVYKNNMLYKKCITDSHKARVNKMFVSFNRVITLSDDCMMSVHELIENGYRFRSVIMNMHVTKVLDNKLYMNDGCELSIHNIEYKEDMLMFEKIGYYKNKCESEVLLRTDSEILAYDVTDKFLVYSTCKETVICHNNEKTEIIKSFGPAHDVKFYKEYLCLTNYKKNLTFISLKTFETTKEIILDEYDEKMIVLSNYILIKGKNIFVDEELNTIEIITKQKIEHAIQIDDKIYLLNYTENYTVNTPYEINCYSIENKSITTLVSIKQVMRIDNMVLYDNKLILNDIENLFIYDLKDSKISKYHIGKFIMGLNTHSNGIVVAHKPVDDVLDYNETNKKLKIKWKRKLVNK